MEYLTNDQELKFVRHIFDRLRSEITGRSIDQLVNVNPRDMFHAGVLLPREMELASHTGVPSDSSSGLDDQEVRLVPKIDSDSSLGLDFLVRLPSGEDTLDLRIKVKLCVYYPVFPSHDEVLVSMSLASQQEDDAVDEAEDRADVDPELLQTSPDDDLIRDGQHSSVATQIANDVVGGIEQTGVTTEDLLILPLKFRKKIIDIPDIDLVLNPRNLVPPIELRDQFNHAVINALKEISNDENVWRHLGTPSDAVREIKGVGLRSSESRYNQALAAAATGEIAVRPWSAYLSITGEETLVLNQPDDVSDSSNTFRLNISINNATPAFDRAERRRQQIEEGSLFDCYFSVEVLNGTIVPFEFQGAAKDYRYERNFQGIGSNCVAKRAEVQGREIIETETVPLFEQPWYRTRNDLPVLFEDLDDTNSNGALAKLLLISGEMQRYLEDWDKFLKDDGLTTLSIDQIATCKSDRDNFASEVQRFQLGIECLQRDKNLIRAFRLMNRAFKEIGVQRNIRSWRLFQIVFMVIQLPSLAARNCDLSNGEEYTQRLKNALESVDVLWFPTGGGKTEAYLGLITTGLFYDRLRGKERGVSAWMRFPLRMLSLQQLERLAKVVAKAETIRSTELDLASRESDPFSIGYFVGGGNTPNRIRENQQNDWKRLQVLRYCPFCESDVQMEFDATKWSLIHRCGNKECYTNTSLALGNLKGSIPVYIVDNEIYRYRTSVLVGTVDKLAVLGFQKHFAHLVAPVNQKCPDHGYLSFGECIEKSSGGPCKKTSRNYVSLQNEIDPVPAFLIQDELHLLKEELGTFNSHYEGFLQHIAQKQNYLPPKILAATATIEAYEAQTFHLYLKNANRFPLPGWREGESMYATSQPREQKRRLYAGVLTHRKSSDSSVLRTLEIYHRIIQDFKNDPIGTLKLIGIEDVSENVFLHFLRLYDLSLTYVNRKATGGNVAYGLNQMVSPRLPAPITTQLLTGDNTMTEVGQVIERINKERSETEQTRLDALIATSLISHGVDLERINFMCMAGMPSKFAEYIQASSRAARNHVGLVVVCFKRSDMRERSQYHYFLPNHRYLDRLVDAVPINRFSAYAPERTVPGLISGLLLTYYSRQLYDRNIISKSLDNLRTLRQVIDSGQITVEQIRQDIEAIIGSTDPRISDMQRRHLTEEITSAIEDNWDQINRSLESRLNDAIRPMSSFRDVDETIGFIAADASSLFVEKIRSSD